MLYCVSVHDFLNGVKFKSFETGIWKENSPTEKRFQTKLKEVLLQPNTRTLKIASSQVQVQAQELPLILQVRQTVVF